MENIKQEYEIIEAKAEILKALAHPVRLCIVRGLLQNGPCNVNKMQVCLDVAQSTVSQHLARLKAAGIIAGERRGVEVFYRVVRDDVARLVSAMFDE